LPVDTGGTFTDLVAFDRDSNSVLFTKSLTNYQDFVAPFAACIERAPPRDWPHRV
jgi:N-methylhydantoinase A/oxoprolinase/acetone carboxylase beta subunit